MALEILNQFKKQFPELISLEPKIEIIKKNTFDNSNTEEIQINVIRSFIFDSRLVPKDFLGINVNDIILTNTLPKFLILTKIFPYGKLKIP